MSRSQVTVTDLHTKESARASISKVRFEELEFDALVRVAFGLSINLEGMYIQVAEHQNRDRLHAKLSDDQQQIALKLSDENRALRNEIGELKEMIRKLQNDTSSEHKGKHEAHVSGHKDR